MVATRGRTFKRPWRRSCLSSKLKSSSAPIGRKDSWCFHAVGSSNAPLLGSTAAEGLPRIGRTSIATRWRSCGLPQSASCSENFVIPPDVFGQTLRLGSLSLLLADLRKQGIVTKVRTIKSGTEVGGIPFTRGPLAHLLRNRFYIGEVIFKGEVLAGEQPAIVDRDLFNAVQAKLSEQVNNHKTTRMKSEALLVRRIFDDRGNRMSPSHARKRGVKYRYYLSSALLEGRPDHSGSIRRVPAAEIEALVIRSVREHLELSASMDDKTLVSTHIERIEIKTDQLVIQLFEAQTTNRQRKKAN